MSGKQDYSAQKIKYTKTSVQAMQRDRKEKGENCLRFFRNAIISILLLALLLFLARWAMFLLIPAIFALYFSLTFLGTGVVAFFQWNSKRADLKELKLRHPELFKEDSTDGLQ